MATEQWIDDLMPKAMSGLTECWACPIGTNTERGLNLAGQRSVHRVLDAMVSVLFPGCHGREAIAESDIEGDLGDRLRETALELKEQVRRAFAYRCKLEKCTECGDCGDLAEAAVSRLVAALPEIQTVLQRDIVAAFEGDPAAKSTMEVVMSYPGVFAVIVHRIAHVLQLEKVPLIPRIMSEHAHSRTGIDIHPGARIGPGFFIDHGTGVVIGETCVIGSNVKLYQGVTLGARSFEKDDEGRPVKGIKRHPNVGDNVVIYAGATILGGDTSIGSDSEIGGNVWLTHSVPPGSKVYNRQPQPLIKEYDGTWKVAGGPWPDLGAGI